jgi:glycosyltransferase involved in cell wall biosynthesis
VEHRVGAPVALPLQAMGSITRSQGILAMLEQFAQVPSMLRRANVPPYSRRPLVAMTCWLAERATHSTKQERMALARRFSGVDLFVYWSKNQTEIYQELLGISPDRLYSVPYGTDPAWYTPRQSSGASLEVVAVGQDLGRDYATLAAAARGANFTAHIYCRDDNVAGLDLPRNVIRHEPVDNVTYRDVLRRASLVVVPTHVLAYPTGQSVALDAMATAKCCVLTQTAAMAEYFNHGDQALFVPPHDPEALRTAIMEALGDDELRARVGASARASVEAVYNTREMWRNVAEAIGRFF